MSELNCTLYLTQLIPSRNISHMVKLHVVLFSHDLMTVVCRCWILTTMIRT